MRVKCLLLVAAVLGPGLARAETRCTNTCNFAGDGDCDDGGPGSEYSFCPLGSDCAVCGPRQTNTSATSATGEWWITYVHTAFNRTDRSPTSWSMPQPGFGNSNGMLELGEWRRLVWLLNVERTLTGMYGTNGVQDAFNTTDTNRDGHLTTGELANYVLACMGGDAACGNSVTPEQRQALGNQVLLALTGVPDPTQVVSGIAFGAFSPSIMAANAMLKVRFTAAQNPEDLFPAERDMIKTTIRNSLYHGCSHGGVCPPLEEIAMTLLQGSMVVTVTAFFPDQSTANSAGATLMSDWNSPTFQTSLGLTGTSAPTVSVAPTTGSGVLKFVNPIIYAVASLILCMTGCALGSCCAKRARKAPSKADKSASEEVPYRGCCSTGCCSTYAISGWAWTTDIACIFLLVSMGMLYHTMLAMTDAIICILDQIYELRNSASADARAATDGIGPILDLINPFRQYLVLLSVAVVVPGVLAALFMFLSSLCACGHHCCDNRLAGCSKFFLMITYIFIILSFVIGVVATALAPLIQVFGKEMITTVTAICETTRPVLEQTLYDSRTAMSNAMAAGADPASVTDLNTLLLGAEEPVEMFGIACVCLVEFFNTAVDLFSPGICNILASIFALYASYFSCWTTGCCVMPHTAKTSQVTCAGMIFCLCFGNCWGRRAIDNVETKVETGIHTVSTSSSASAGQKGFSSSATMSTV
jgi:hypothetical protein